MPAQQQSGRHIALVQIAANHSQGLERRLGRGANGEAPADGAAEAATSDGTAGRDANGEAPALGAAEVAAGAGAISTELQ
jgi:hypothetical protein